MRLRWLLERNAEARKDENNRSGERPVTWRAFHGAHRVPADLGADPTESQRGCLRVPHGAVDPAILNTRCPHMPAPAPRSRDLEMRYTASSGIEGSNPSRSGFPYRIRDIGAECKRS